jgi:hypothetical protein
VKRKLAEGEVSDPFTRRKTKPVLSTGGKVRLVKVKGTVSKDTVDFKNFDRNLHNLALIRLTDIFLLDTWY